MLSMKTILNKPLALFQSPFFIKLFNWEYWPVYLTNIPTVCYWLYFAIRARQLFFFSAVNPVIETGGVLGESKINILNRIPKAIIPKTIFIAIGRANLDYILKAAKDEGICFPLIVKPDIGERGFLVEKINDEKAFADYVNRVNVDFLVQELITYPVEISVLYHRMPDKEKGKITSVCIKKMLTITGDGVSTIETLMKNYPRASLQLNRFQKEQPAILKNIPAAGEIRILEPIGNHSRGTTFLNGNQHIDKQLEAVFDKISLQMENMLYGRFDMKCQSIAALKAGKGFKILEFNGVAGEPAHIYDPEYPLIQAYKDLYQHWKIIYHISQKQMAKGISVMTWKEAVRSVKTYRAYMRNAQRGTIA
ncbi:MAG: hypothetical protein ACI8P3_003671 [Saprospiraceae bacterium]|jgi:hypothetical protein